MIKNRLFFVRYMLFCRVCNCFSYVVSFFVNLLYSRYSSILLCFLKFNFWIPFSQRFHSIFAVFFWPILCLLNLFQIRQVGGQNKSLVGLRVLSSLYFLVSPIFMILCPCTFVVRGFWMRALAINTQAVFYYPMRAIPSVMFISAFIFISLPISITMKYLLYFPYLGTSLLLTLVLLALCSWRHK